MWSCHDSVHRLLCFRSHAVFPVQKIFNAGNEARGALGLKETKELSEDRNKTKAFYLRRHGQERRDGRVNVDISAGHKLAQTLGGGTANHGRGVFATFPKGVRFNLKLSNVGILRQFGSDQSVQFENRSLKNGIIVRVG
jgi:hypothetical protein